MNILSSIMEFSKLFVDVTTLPQDGYGFFQLIFLTAIYGYILAISSKLVSDGSELLLLIPRFAGLVGSVVLPVLGAVPDGCIVLFSGLGSNAAEGIAVGVGALAGSTIVILTVPWFLSILVGSVKVDPLTNTAVYMNLSPRFKSFAYSELDTLGITLTPTTNQGGYLMLLTLLSYPMIQIPNILYMNESENIKISSLKFYSLVTLSFCSICFVKYLYDQYAVRDTDPVENRVIEDAIIKGINNGNITLLGIMHCELELLDHQINNNKSINEATPLSNHFHNEKAILRLTHLLKPFFAKYDVDRNGSLDRQELAVVLRDIGEYNMTKDDVDVLFDTIDVDKSNSIQFDEFVRGMFEYVKNSNHLNHDKSQCAAKHDCDLTKEEMDDWLSKQSTSKGAHEEGDEEEMPVEFIHLSPDEQQQRVLRKAVILLTIGTLVIVLFSDPMVGSLTEIGKRTGVPPFYISFIFVPIVSCASEFIAAYNYASKRTVQSTTVSLSTLQGACVMNNTFVMGIFMFLMYYQSFPWTFFAETTAIVVVVCIVSCMSLKKTHTIRDAIVILLLYPFSLVLVAVLEFIGWN